MKLKEILEWSAKLAGCDAVPADSQVYVEAPADVRKVLIGVDIDSTELLWAQQNGFDAVIAHHPIGDRARTDFAKVVHRQIDQMAAEGIDVEVARTAVESRLERIHRSTHMSNINRVVDTARLIGMPLCNVHLACDILGRNAIIELLSRRDHGSHTVADALNWLDEFPEIKIGPTRPEAWLGQLDHELGRWTVAMAGGTNGGHPVFREYFRAGVDTIFAMHIAEEDLQRLHDDPLAKGKTLVVTGHMATDSIGINEMIRGLEAKGIAITTTSGIVAPN